MSLNRKRRIFRPATLRMPSLPAPGLILAGVAALGALGAGSWGFLRPSSAPAQPPVISRLTASPSEIAILDGATMRLRDRVIRLDGIRPALRGQDCRRPNGSMQDCGVAAVNALAAMVRDAPVVECRVHGHDPTGRALAFCSARGTDLNAGLVLAGWARANADQQALLAGEATARAGGRGIWASP